MDLSTDSNRAGTSSKSLSFTEDPEFMAPIKSSILPDFTALTTKPSLNGLFLDWAKDEFIIPIDSAIKKNKEIDFIVEDNKLKHNKFIPGVKIAIKSKSSIKSKNHTLLILAWNFFNEIKKNNSDISNNFVNIKDLEN